MIAAVTVTHIDPSRADEATELFRSTVVPAVKAQPGAIETSLYVDRQTGKGIAVGIWESEEAALAWESGGHYQEVLGQFAGFFTAPPGDREIYEVAVKA